MIVHLAQLPRPLPFVDTVPEWLAPVLLLLGTASVVLWACRQVIDRLLPVDDRPVQMLVLLSAVLGIVFTSLGALAQAGLVGQFATLLVAAGRVVEGGAAVRGVRKLHYYITKRPFVGNDSRVSPSQTGGKSVAPPSKRRESKSNSTVVENIVEEFWPKIRYRIITIVIGIITTVLYLVIVVYSGVQANTLYYVVLTWTLSVFMLAMIGISWKLESADEQLPPSLTIGLILSFTGAQIFNYVNLIWDITALLISLVAFILGLIIGALAVLLS